MKRSITSLLTIAIFLSIGLSVGDAAEITVNEIGDIIAPDRRCSLREAVLAAQNEGVIHTCQKGDGNDVIKLGANTYKLNEVLEINSGKGDLVIEGVGAGKTVIMAEGNHRVFHIGGGDFNVTFRNLAIKNGNAGEDGNGGGILSQSNGGVVIEKCHLFGNTAKNGGGIAAISGKLFVKNSTLSGNKAVTGQGGAIFSNAAEVRIINSTISENQAQSGGALAGAFDTSYVIRSSTLTQNSAIEQGGGVFSGTTNAFGVSPSLPVQLMNTILVGNIGKQIFSSDCFGNVKLSSLGHNILGVSLGCELESGPGDQFNRFGLPVDPKLLALQTNAPLPTHPLAVGSPAIDAADDSQCLQRDQLGADRLPTCDIGAVEARSLFDVGLLTKERIASRVGELVPTDEPPSDQPSTPVRPPLTLPEDSPLLDLKPPEAAPPPAKPDLPPPTVDRGITGDVDRPITGDEEKGRTLQSGGMSFCSLGNTVGSGGTYLFGFLNLMFLGLARGFGRK